MTHTHMIITDCNFNLIRNKRGKTAKCNTIKYLNKNGEAVNDTNHKAAALQLIFMDDCYSNSSASDDVDRLIHCDARRK